MNDKKAKADARDVELVSFTVRFPKKVVELLDDKARRGIRTRNQHLLALAMLDVGLPVDDISSEAAA